jgi:predicted dehydrogenase
MRSLRIGIVGKRGTAHAAGFRAHSHAEVTALCDADPATLAREADALGIDGRFTELEPMLDHVDAVFVATPMHLHAEQALTALGAGKHVLSEVTACVSLDECRALVEAVRSTGLTYMLAENYLYFEENLIVR